jgi:integrase
VRMSDCLPARRSPRRWGLERGYVDQNPAQGIKDIRRPRGTPRANRPWTDAERYAVLEASSWALKVPIALAMFAGLREGDALAIPSNAYDGAKLNFVTGKTGQRICWPVSSALKEILDGAPRHQASTLAANSHGRTWTGSGFRASWRTLRIKLEQQGKVELGLTIHGLRHTVATILREEGLRRAHHRGRSRAEDRQHGPSVFARRRFVPENGCCGRASRGGGEQTALRSCQTSPENCQTLNREVTVLSWKHY